MLPNGWLSTQLGKLFGFKNGLNAEKESYGKGIPFINVMDVFQHDVLLASDVRGLIQASEKHTKDYAVKYGDVLFNRTSETFDEIAMAAVYLDEKPVVFGGFVIRARPVTKSLSPHFCAYFFRSSTIRREMIRRGQGAIRANIGQGDLSLIPVLIPPIEEQEKIAEILSTWDRAIETTEKLIVNSQAQKKALMQQLLTGKKRLSGFSNKWTAIQLGEAFKERTERSMEGLTLLSVSQSQGIVPQDQAGRRNISSSDLSKYKVVRIGDIAYNTMRMWQGASALSSHEGIVSPAYTVLTRKNGHCAKFYSYLFKYPRMIHTFERYSQGLVSDTWNLKFPALSIIKVLVPEEEEQLAIADVLATCDEGLSAKMEYLERLKSEKSALMQQLLTGKRRVKITNTAKECVNA